MSDDIYENKERISLPEEDEYFECFNCGFVGSNPMVIEEFGMKFYLCENCGQEVF